MNPAHDIERSMASASRAVRAGIRDALTDAAKVARAELDATATLVPGPDRQFSGFKTAGKLRLKVRRFADAVVVVPVGPWGLAERGRKPSAHDKGTQATQGKRAWTRGRDAALARLGRTIPATIGDTVAKEFKR